VWWRVGTKQCRKDLLEQDLTHFNVKEGERAEMYCIEMASDVFYFMLF